MTVWQDRIPILRLGERVVIKPSWQRYTPAAGEIVLEMDPGVAFGTGLHPTTQLCVAALEKWSGRECTSWTWGPGRVSWP